MKHICTEEFLIGWPDFIREFFISHNYKRTGGELFFEDIYTCQDCGKIVKRKHTSAIFPD